MTLSHFPQFTNLPLELQREIWKTILDEDPEPTVHIFRWDDDDEFLSEQHGHLLPELVDTDLHPLMHVCHESRSMARKQLQFRDPLADGTCLGPCRAFRPDLDAVYVSSRDWPVFFFEGFLRHHSQEERPQRQGQATAALQHLALDARVVGVGALDGLRDVARHLGRFGGLRTVSVVFSEEGWVPRDHVPTGDMGYRLVSCARGQTVWNAPAGEVKRRDMDAWEVVRGFEEALLSQVGVGVGVGVGVLDENRDLEDDDGDGNNAGRFRFRVIAQNIVPKGRKHAYYDAGDSGWVKSIFRGVRGLLLS